MKKDSEVHVEGTKTIPLSGGSVQDDPMKPDPRLMAYVRSVLADPYATDAVTKTALQQLLDFTERLAEEWTQHFMACKSVEGAAAALPRETKDQTEQDSGSRVDDSQCLAGVRATASSNELMPTCVVCGQPATREFCYPAEPWVPYCEQHEPQYATAGKRKIHKPTCDMVTGKGMGLSENIIVTPKCTCGPSPLQRGTSSREQPMACGANFVVYASCPKCKASWNGPNVPTKCPQCGNEDTDAACECGTALDVHCCNCHSGFIFDKDHECEAATQ